MMSRRISGSVIQAPGPPALMEVIKPSPKPAMEMSIQQFQQIKERPNVDHGSLTSPRYSAIRSQTDQTPYRKMPFELLFMA
jgi:hypothetical protein